MDLLSGDHSIQFSRAVERVEIVASAYVGFANKDLRKRARATGPLNHFLTFVLIARGIYFLKLHALLVEQVFRCSTKPAPFARIYDDFGHSNLH